MIMSTTQSSFVVVLLLISVLFVDVSVCNNGGQGDHNGGGGLTMGFYRRTCPSLETTVRRIIRTELTANPKLAAHLLRLQFHDCFVMGCDASVLLDSTQTNKAEKEAVPNLTLAGFEVLDKIKTQLEEDCPKTVSCADILALAAQEAVLDAASFKLPLPLPLPLLLPRPLWTVLTGRKDGRVSLVSEANRLLPSPFSNFTTIRKQFADQNLLLEDLVALLGGAHTIGETHCFLIGNRLYNFTGKGDADPSLNPQYADILRGLCPSATSPSAIEMDHQSSLSFDTHYFTMIVQNKSIFQSDAALLTDPDSAKLVRKLQNPGPFLKQFGLSMSKVLGLGVLTGKDGEIRENCHVVNPTN